MRCGASRPTDARPFRSSVSSRRLPRVLAKCVRTKEYCVAVVRRWKGNDGSLSNSDGGANVSLIDELHALIDTSVAMWEEGGGRCLPA